MAKIEPITIETIATVVTADDLVVDGEPCCATCYANALANKKRTEEAPADSYIGKLALALAKADPTCLSVAAVAVDEPLIEEAP